MGVSRGEGVKLDWERTRAREWRSGAAAEGKEVGPTCIPFLLSGGAKVLASCR